jgi:hypothetical protein
MIRNLNSKESYGKAATRDLAAIFEVLTGADEAAEKNSKAHSGENK